LVKFAKRVKQTACAAKGERPLPASLGDSGIASDICDCGIERISHLCVPWIRRKSWCEQLKHLAHGSDRVNACLWQQIDELL